MVQKCFDHLVIRSKWKHSTRNLVVGDLVLIKSSGKFAPGDYKRGRVVETLRDDDNRVRTVYVQVYRGDSRREAKVYQGEGQTKVRMAVQRLIVLMPIEEIKALESGEDDSEFGLADIHEVDPKLT